MHNPAVLAALFTGLAMVAAAVVTALAQRSARRIDSEAADRAAKADRAAEAAERAADALEDARQKLLDVKDEHIAMLTAQLEAAERQKSALASKVAAFEARPARSDDA